MSLFRLVPTGLDLNGPDLSFTTNPVGVATSTAGIATFTGIATALLLLLVMFLILQITLELLLIDGGRLD